MTTPNIQMTPEVAAIVFAVNNRSGIPANTVAINARTSSRHEVPQDAVAVPTVTQSSEPLFTLNGSVLRSTTADLSGLRLGVSVSYQHGVAVKWTLVIRKNGVRCCELDYSSEVLCEVECDDIRQYINVAIERGITLMYVCNSKVIRNFNMITGAEL